MGWTCLSILLQTTMTDLLVLFDIDGTLIDSDGQISDTMAAAFEAAGLPPPSRAQVTETIGLSLPEMVESLAAQSPVTITPDCCAKIAAGYRLRDADATMSMEEPPVFPGAETTLWRLRRAGVTLGIATGKSRVGMNYVLDAMDWHGYFKTVQCADDNPSKPDPAMLEKALAEIGIDRTKTVFVGDTWFDMEMASACDVRAIGVAWGYQEPELLLSSGAETVVDNFDALVTLLLEPVS